DRPLPPLRRGAPRRGREPARGDRRRRASGGGVVLRGPHGRASILDVAYGIGERRDLGPDGPGARRRARGGRAAGRPARARTDRRAPVPLRRRPDGRTGRGGPVGTGGQATARARRRGGVVVRTAPSS